MDEPDRQRLDQAKGERELHGNEETRFLLRRLRRPLNMRDVNRCGGISGSYLSQIENGERRPGANMVCKLAAFYNVGPKELLKRAFHATPAQPLQRRDPGGAAGLPLRAG